MCGFSTPSNSDTNFLELAQTHKLRAQSQETALSWHFRYQLQVQVAGVPLIDRL